MPDRVAYQLIEGALSSETLSSVVALYEKTFEAAGDKIRKTLLTKEDSITIVASDAPHQEIVGFKVGYPQKDHRFYSWLGGVHPTYRRQGIGSELMRQQHDYCQRAGFHTIRTKTTNQWRAMLLLNIRHRFDVIGTYVDEQGDVKIILEKRLL